MAAAPGTLEVLLVSAKGLENTDFLCTYDIAHCCIHIYIYIYIYIFFFNLLSDSASAINQIHKIYDIAVNLNLDLLLASQ
jgi:hypothetical protein